MSESRRIFVCVFLYAVLASFFIQFIFLPYFFPALHAGNGLLTKHDWVTYHRVAAEMVEYMKAGGWGKWELRPFGWVEPGLISLVYYFTVSKPWVLIPFNAFFHAASAVLVFLLVRDYIPTKTKWMGLLAVVPFAFFPSSLLWVTQIHKDGIAFFSCFLFIFGMTRLYRLQPLNASLCILVGCLLGWIVRPYLGDVFIVQLALFSLFLTLRAVVTRKHLTVLVVAWGLTFLLRPLLDEGTYRHKVPTPEEKAKILAESGGVGFESSTLGVRQMQIPKHQPAEVQKLVELPQAQRWVNTPFVPTFFENKLFSIAQIRFGYSITLSNTNVDDQIQFYRVADVVRYIPRALGILFFQPSPFTLVNSQGSTEPQFLKKLVRVEILYTYLLLPFTLLTFWLYRKKVEMWGVVLSSTFFMLVYALTVTNVGSLHRFRYGFLTLILAFAVPSLYAVFFQKRYPWVHELRFLRVIFR